MQSLTTRISRSVQTTIGWIFWDPGAVRRYEALGVPGALGYVASRAAPLAPAGPDAVVAAFGSISPPVVRWVFDLVADFDPFWGARDEAVVEGLRQHAPAIVAPLSAAGPELWRVVDGLPSVGRVLFGAHWALVAAAGLSGVEASILHNAWLGYDRDWLPRSRGSGPDEIAAGWASLQERGLADDGAVTPAGIDLRQQLEDDTDRLCTLIWASYGADRTVALAEVLEPPCELLLKRVDETAGPNYQPASRIRG